MLKINPFIGGVLLVSGTTIGGAMLAVPVTTAFMGFWPSLCLSGICWVVMLFAAFCFIDVNCAYKDETNIITMAGRTLGMFGKSLGWIFYMLLLYALLAAYISASAPLFSMAIEIGLGFTIPSWLAPFCLPLVFGSFVYLGTRGVDLINRIFMMGLFIAYIVLIFFVPSHVTIENLSQVDLSLTWIAIPILITSFGYHIIIPSLGNYLNHDAKRLKLCVLVGSLITLIIYGIWQFLVLGTVPLEGDISLVRAWVSGQNAVYPLSQLIQLKWVAVGAHLFSFFAIVTSFLGVALSLSDFLIDGFNIKKTWEGKLGACLLTFVPPLFFVFTYQRGFLMALEYAGAFVAVLLIFLPAAMAWKLRNSKFYRSLQGRIFLSSIILFAIGVIVVDFMVQKGCFHFLVEPYLSR